MRVAYALFALLIVPAVVLAQQLAPVYLTSPVAQQHHLPFSSGVVVGNTLYIAGTTGVDPSSKGTVTPTEEARLVMDRVKDVAEQAGMTLDDVVSLQVFCTDLHDYDAFNSVYKTYFHGHYPARSFIGVSNLLFGARYEINGIAIKQGK
jgi:reactive intermediate/imine deaminase